MLGLGVSLYGKPANHLGVRPNQLAAGEPPPHTIGILSNLEPYRLHGSVGGRY